MTNDQIPMTRRTSNDPFPTSLHRILRVNFASFAPSRLPRFDHWDLVIPWSWGFGHWSFPPLASCVLRPHNSPTPHALQLSPAAHLDCRDDHPVHPGENGVADDARPHLQRRHQARIPLV